MQFVDLEDGDGLSVDHDVEHGAPQQDCQHVQQVHLHQQRVGGYRGARRVGQSHIRTIALSNMCE